MPEAEAKIADIKIDRPELAATKQKISTKQNTTIQKDKPKNIK